MSEDRQATCALALKENEEDIA